jgi:opacity protein-like surface antigen
MDMFSAASFIRVPAMPGKVKSLALAFYAATSIPALLAGSASAADLSYKDERPAIAAYSGSWAGLYFGAQAGAIVDGDRDDNRLSSGSVAGDGGGGGGAGDGDTGGAGGDGGDAFSVFSDDSDSDALVGLHIGYNWQNANVVYGIEADIDANDSLDNLLGSVRARLGYASDRSLLYLTAGLAYLSVDGGSSVFARGAGGAGGVGGDAVGANGGAAIPGAGSGTQGVSSVSNGSDSDVGFVAGAGFEYKLTNQVGLGVEGLYYTFDDNNAGLSSDGDFFTVRARLTMHLDRGEGGSVKDGYPALASNWGGFYLGGHLGAGLTSSDSFTSADSNNGGDGGDGGDGIGDNAGGGGGGGGGGSTAGATFAGEASFLGGVHLGYNVQRGQMVYGIEGDASFGDSDKFDYLASARARLGYASGRHLFYATAGVAFAGVNGVSQLSAGNGGDGEDGGDSPDNGGDGLGGLGGAGGVASVTDSSDDKVGFVVGAGVDTKLSDRLTLGLEGLYFGFEDDDVRVSGGGASVVNEDDNDVFVLRGKISYSLSPAHEALK